MDKEKIVEKVKKLMNLSHSDNEGEAMQALKMAQKLMAQYHISQESVEESESSDVEMFAMEEKTKSIPNSRRFLSVMLAKHFRCRVVASMHCNSEVFNHHRLVFIGEKVDVEALKEVYLYIVKTYDQLSAKYISKLETDRSGKLKERNSYMLGFSKGCDEALSEQENECKETALMRIIPNTVEERMAAEFPNLSFHRHNLKYGEMKSYERGMSDGSFAIRNRNRAIL